MVAMAYPVVDDPEDSSKDTVKVDKGSLPQKHQSFSPVFSLQEAKGLAAVDRHAHAIELEDGAAPPYGPIYPLAEPELVSYGSI
jgi:hypothetical protein